MAGSEAGHGEERLKGAGSDVRAFSFLRIRPP
jgi:hypothetical protein